MSKMLCFDIDGTLIDADGSFPESAQYALRQAARAGHKLVLCTGRNRPSIQKKLLEFGFDGIISSAGASVIYQDKVISQKRIDKKHLRFFSNYCTDHGITFFVQGGEFNSANEKDARVLVEHYQKHEVFISVGERFLEEHKIFRFVEEVTDGEKLMYYFSPKSILEMQKEIGDYYFILPFGHKNADLSCGEVIQRGVTKAYGIQKMMDFLHVAREDVYAFGDGPNDIEMLRFAGVGIAMGNGSASAFEAADMVAGPIGSEGILKALRSLGLIQV